MPKTTKDILFFPPIFVRMSPTKPKYYLKAFCIFYVLLLGMMAFYFIKIMELKKKEIHTITHEKVDALTTMPFYKQLTLAKENELYNSFLNLLKNRATLNSLQRTLALNVEENSDFFTQKVDSAFKDLKYDVAVRSIVSQITLNASGETLLEEPITVLETRKKVQKPRRINTSEWEINESSIRKGEEECLDCPEDYLQHFTFFQELHIEVVNMYRIAFKELAPLLVISILICAFILILFYITYQAIKQKEREVIHLHDMVDTVSHELKLPIATLKYGYHNLSKEYNSPTIALLERQITRLEKIVYKLLPVADNDCSFDNDLFRAILKDLQLVYPEVIFHTHWAAEKTLPFPSSELETLLLNLLENSAKYGATEITCTLTQDNNTICLTVADDGFGIDKENQKLVFTKFYRIIKNNIHTTTGLGIGLYQVQQIVKQLNGNITMTSRPNEGTTFKITLPYA